MTSTRCVRSPRNIRYLGLIGSRAEGRSHLPALLQEGFPAESLEGVYAPIGFEIGAVAGRRSR